MAAHLLPPQESYRLLFFIFLLPIFPKKFGAELKNFALFWTYLPKWQKVAKILLTVDAKHWSKLAKSMAAHLLPPQDFFSLVSVRHFFKRGVILTKFVTRKLRLYSVAKMSTNLARSDAKIILKKMSKFLKDLSSSF